MSIFHKIKEKLAPKVSVVKSEPLMPSVNTVKHEFMKFSDSYRIGLLGIYTDYDSQKPFKEYKYLLEKNGYECEVLMYVDNKIREASMYLPAFDWNDLDKNKLPHSPQTDRFMLRRFDILINLYFEPCDPLLYISNMSHAKCRVGPYVDIMHPVTDIMIQTNNDTSIVHLYQQINAILNLQPYVRKNF